MSIFSRHEACFAAVSKEADRACLAEAERDLYKALLPAAREYAKQNPRWTYFPNDYRAEAEGVPQDPNGVHRALEAIDAAARSTRT